MNRSQSFFLIPLLGAGILCAVMACSSTSRWRNPAGGIPSHPGGAPPIAFIEEREAPPQDVEDHDIAEEGLNAESETNPEPDPAPQTTSSDADVSEDATSALENPY